jgi:hypothetical protein
LSNITELPYNLRFEGKYLFGQIPEIVGNAEHTEINCEITTFDGITKPFILIVAVYNSAVDEENAPTNDPLLDIVLNLPFCCYRHGSGFCIDGTSSCSDELGEPGSGNYPCGGPEQVCNDWDGKAGECYCQ